MSARKRLFDWVVAFLGLLMLSPLLVVIAIAIKLESPGPIFFRQERVGLRGKTFRIFKFRTMSMASRGAALTVAGDTRITRVGAVLRRYKLDELPQLIDVLRGTMSLVGPRPEVPHYVAHYPPAWRDRLLSVRPGITDFASIHYRDENELLANSCDPEHDYVHLILPAKLKHALTYVDNPTLRNDLKVLGLTFQTVLTPSRSLPADAMNDSPFSLSLWRALDRRMTRLRPQHGLWVWLVDVLIILVCWHLTYLFRLGFERWQPGRPWYDDGVSLAVVLVYSLCLVRVGMPRSVWRFFGFTDFKRLAGACLLAGLVCASAILMAQLVEVPRAVLILHPLFTLVALTLARMSYRMIWEHARSRVHGASHERRLVIVMGAGSAAHRLIAGLHQREGWTVLAMLDDDPAKHGLQIGGVPVLGGLSQILEPHIRLGATHVIIAMPGAKDDARAKAVELASQTGLVLLMVPQESELLGRVINQEAQGPPG